MDFGAPLGPAVLFAGGWAGRFKKQPSRDPAPFLSPDGEAGVTDRAVGAWAGGVSSPRKAEPLGTFSQHSGCRRDSGRLEQITWEQARARERTEAWPARGAAPSCPLRVNRVTRP